MLIKGNLRTNVTHEFGHLDVEASTLVPVDSTGRLSLIRQLWDREGAGLFIFPDY